MGTHDESPNIAPTCRLSTTIHMFIHIVSTAYPYRGGIAHFVETMARGYQHLNHKTEIVTFTRQYPELLFPGETQYEQGHAPQDLQITRQLDTLNPFSWQKTARYIADARPDLVLMKYWMPFFAPSLGWVARSLRKKGIPTIAIIDNAIPHEKRLGDEALSRYFLSSCKGLVVMSDAVGEDVRRLGVTCPIEKVRHPIYNLFGEPMPKPQARAELGLAETEDVLLFFGFIRRYKGLHVLLEAMPKIIAARPKVRLVVAGEFYEDAQPYHAQIEALGLADHLRLATQYIPNEDVVRYFSAADVVVQPYISATQSGVAQIAFQFDRPTVLTDVGGLAEIVPHEEAGLVVPPADPNALADAVIRYFEADLAPKLTEGVQREKRKYEWSVLYEAIERLYRA